jgi:glutathione S-transferase
MRLYDLDHSPFAARVRMALYAKGLTAALAPPPGGVRSAAYRAINPLALVPALMLDDGTVIPESEIIAEYLEDRFPNPPLRPTAPEDRARARLLARLADEYLAPPLKELFEAAKAGGGAEKATVPRAAVDGALGHIARYLGDGAHAAAYAVGGRLTTADCALVPLLFFAARAARMHPVLFPDGDPFAFHPRLAAYWRGIARDPVAARVLGELEAAQVRRAAARARGEPEN